MIKLFIDEDKQLTLIQQNKNMYSTNLERNYYNQPMTDKLIINLKTNERIL